MGDFELRDARSGDEPAIRHVVNTVLAEFGFNADPSGEDSDLDDIARSYLEPGGAFRVLVSASGEIVGCAGLRPIASGAGELRKMYILPVARGRGWGRQLLLELLAHARRNGLRQLELETHSKLGTARALYRSLGFVEITRDDLSDRCDLAMEVQL